MFKILATTVAFSLAALTANAATVTSNVQDAAELAALASTSTFLAGGTTLSGAVTTFGSTPSVARSPFDVLPGFGSIGYFNVLGNGAANVATLTLASVRTSLSFLWGSPDTYNLVTLFNGENSLNVVLADLFDPNSPVEGSGATFVTISGFSFDRVEFVSTSPAFELSNIAAVPLPAGGLLLIGALGGLAALRRRKALAA